MIVPHFGDERLPSSFWDRVSPCPMSGCWIWTGYVLVSSDGTRRGQLRIDGRLEYAHRLVYQTLIGPNPRGRNLFRKCGMGECCNPDHIAPGSSISKPKKSAQLARLYGGTDLKRRRKSAMLKHQYGITIDQYDLILAAQDGKCAICCSVFGADEKSPRVDHDHKTGVVRGLLCLRCNTGLGSFRDSAAYLEAASAYIAKAGQ